MPDEDMAQPIDEDDFGDFEDFSSATKPLENGSHAKIEPSEIDHLQAPSPPTQLGDTAAPVKNDFETFGVSDSASVAPSKSDHDLGGFGDFMEIPGKSARQTAADAKLDIQEGNNGMDTYAFPGNSAMTADPKACTPDSSSVGGYDTAREHLEESSLAQGAPDQIGNVGEAPTTTSEEHAYISFDDSNTRAELETPAAVSEATDQFGSFVGAPAPMEAAPRLDDDFGGFCFVPVAPNNVESDPADDFGDFGVAPKTDTNATADGAGDVGTSSAAQGTPDCASDDDFGNFGSAPTIESAATIDGFGGFGDFGGVTSTQDNVINSFAVGYGTNSGMIQSNTAFVTTDGLQDFGSTTATLSAFETTIADGFGDFGSAPAIEADQTTVGNGYIASATATLGTSEHITTDDFGDFGDFDGSPTTLAAASFNSCGVHGDEANSEPVSFPDRRLSNPEFGKLDRALAAESARIEQTTSDDFGDFKHSATADVLTHAAEQNNGDKFGHFPAFVESEPTQQHMPSTVRLSSVGSSRPPVKHPKPLQEADPGLQKASAVFAKVFEWHAPDDWTNGIGGLSEAVLVESLVSSIESDSSRDFSVMFMEEFQTILNELEKEALPPVFILAEGEGYCPNAHFSVPVGGEGTFEISKRQALQTHLGVHQQARLAPEDPTPTPNGTSLEVADTPQKESIAKKTEPGGQQLSERLQRFLNQIPDLSCLLSPKLTLPSNT